ncbi:MAG: copper resistance protein CopC, partial [Solirubrobacteraceae bacterium]
MKRTLTTLLLASALVLAGAPAAFAHAQLLGTSPLSGATVAKQPSEVIFKFNQAVGGTLGAVRVYNAQGQEVDNLDVGHPEGHQHWMGVGLKPDLPDGTYTGTYKVVSADTHIVYGGLVFNIGHAGAAPKFTVAGLIGRGESGEATKLAFGVVRTLDYVSLALGIGGLVFLVWTWLPVLAAVAGAPSAAGGAPASGTDVGTGATATASGGNEAWGEASGAFVRRLKLLFAVAILLGIAVGVLGILLQGASAAGVSLWASVKGPIVKSTLESRFGEVWAGRTLVWVVLGGVLVASRSRRCPARACITAAGVGACLLAITPALSGHPSVQGPRGVFFPADVVHVLGASVWVGGIACFLLVLPAATRKLEGPRRTRLLLATLARFSPLALGCVIAIAITGVVQAYIDVRSFQGLFHSTYGALVIVKVVLLLVLIGFG